MGPPKQKVVDYLIGHTSEKTKKVQKNPPDSGGWDRKDPISESRRYCEEAGAAFGDFHRQ